MHPPTPSDWFIKGAYPPGGETSYDARYILRYVDDVDEARCGSVRLIDFVTGRRRSSHCSLHIV